MTLKKFFAIYEVVYTTGEPRSVEVQFKDNFLETAKQSALIELIDSEVLQESGNLTRLVKSVKLTSFGQYNNYQATFRYEGVDGSMDNEYQLTYDSPWTLDEEPLLRLAFLREFARKPPWVSGGKSTVDPSFNYVEIVSIQQLS